MAAFCACCGAEITRKVEACPVCGTPRHGMLPLDVQPSQNAYKSPPLEDAKSASRMRDSRFPER